MYLYCTNFKLHVDQNFINSCSFSRTLSTTHCQTATRKYAEQNIRRQKWRFCCYFLPFSGPFSCQVESLVNRLQIAPALSHGRQLVLPNVALFQVDRISHASTALLNLNKTSVVLTVKLLQHAQVSTSE